MSGLEFKTSIPPLPFGKFAGKPFDQVEDDYLAWVVRHYRQGGFTHLPILEYLDEYVEAIDERLTGKSAALAKAEPDDSYTLSDSQQLASNSLIEALLDHGEVFARLEGGGGYGKSFVTRDIVKRILRTGQYRVEAMAVSYVATQVLRSQLDRYGVVCNTIARGVGLQKVTDGASEAYVLTERSYSRLKDLFTASDKPLVLLIDEYSMVNDEVAEAIGTVARRYNGKVIAVGDLKQLPPVKQYTDCTFASIPRVAILTQPMRYPKDSDLYRVEQAVRTHPESAESVIRMLDGKGQVSIEANLPQAIKTAHRLLEDHPDDITRILHYRRAQVLASNAAIRLRRFGKNAAELEPGERLLVVRTSDVEDTRYYSGTTLDVMEVYRDEANEELVAILTNGKRVPLVFALNENRADESLYGGTRFNETLKGLSREAKDAEIQGTKRSDAWKAYRQYRDSFVFVAYSYATTVHRSQGATLDHVFVDYHDLLSVPQIGSKLAYVAMTRACKSLHVIL